MSDTEPKARTGDMLEIYQAPNEIRYKRPAPVRQRNDATIYAGDPNIKRICEAHLNGRYDLEVIDLYQQPNMTRQEQIVAAPTLVKSLPLPARRMIGNLSDVERVLAALDLHE